MHEHRADSAVSPYDYHRRDAGRLRAQAISDLLGRIGRMLRRAPARAERPTAGASGRGRARPHPSPARAAW